MECRIVERDSNTNEACSNIRVGSKARAGGSQTKQGIGTGTGTCLNTQEQRKLSTSYPRGDVEHGKEDFDKESRDHLADVQASTIQSQTGTVAHILKAG